MTRAPAGFTLLEVLVALAVLGLVLAGLAQGTRFGLQTTGRQADSIAASADLDATERVLRGLIEQMAPGTVTNAPLLVAGHAALSFTANLAAVAPNLGVTDADVSLAVTPDQRLVLRWAPHVHAIRLAAPPAPAETTLLPGVARVEFDYCCDTATAGWLSAWPERIPPLLVRIRMVFPPGGRPAWPPIIVAPARMRLNG